MNKDKVIRQMEAMEDYMIKYIDSIFTGIRN